MSVTIEERTNAHDTLTYFKSATFYARSINLTPCCLFLFSWPFYFYVFFVPVFFFFSSLFPFVPFLQLPFCPFSFFCFFVFCCCFFAPFFKPRFERTFYEGFIETARAYCM